MNADPFAGLPDDAFGWQPFESDHRAEYAKLSIGEKIKRLEDMQELIDALEKAPRRVGTADKKA